jgi:hypothetical protein
MGLASEGTPTAEEMPETVRKQTTHKFFAKNSSERRKIREIGYKKSKTIIILSEVLNW